MIEEKDVLSQIFITEEAGREWFKVANIAISRIIEQGLPLGEVPIEQAHVIGNKLRIHATTSDGQVLAELLVDEDQWGWMQS